MTKRAADPGQLLRAHAEALLRATEVDAPPEIRSHAVALAALVGDGAPSTRPAPQRAPDAPEAPHGHYFELFDHSPVATFVLAPNGRVLDANLAATTLLGLDRERLIDRAFATFLLQEHVPTLERQLGRVLSTGYTHACELAIRRGDGGPAEIAAELSALMGPSGAITSVLFAAIDVTGRRRIERSLREHGERHRMIFEDCGDGLLILGESWQILDANTATCRLFGAPLREVARRTLWSFFPAATAAEQRARVTQELTSPSPRLFELTVERPVGEPVVIEAAPSIAVSERGRFYLLSLRDVTTRRRSADEDASLLDRLQRAQQLEAIGRLAGGIAHDLGNVLTAVNGLASAVLLDLPAESPLRADMEDLLAANQRGSEITRQLLSFTRKESTHRQGLALAPIAREIVGLASRGLRDVRFEVDVEDGLCVDADPERIGQILLNLVLNSIDATAGGGSIRVEAKRGESVAGAPIARIRVVDDGGGMDEDARAHAFEPFFTTKAPGKGTGLGLTVVYRHVRHLDGTAFLQSEAGKGTTATVELPLSSRGAVTAPSPAPRKATLDDVHVLVIDHEPMVLAALKRMLANLGADADVAGSGAEGLEVFERAPERYGVLLVDLDVDDMDGLAVLRRILERRGDARVLLTSSEPGEGLPEGLRAKRNVGFLRKPCSPPDLAAQAKALLAGEALR